MHIVLFEPHFVGHRPTYLYLYSKLLIESGNDVSIVCGEDEKCRQYLNNEKRLETIRVFPFLEVPGKNPLLSRFSFYNKFLFWKRLRLSLRNIKNIDFVIFMYLDYFLFNFNEVPLKLNFFLNKYFLTSFIDKNLPIKWSGILFHPSHFKNKNFGYPFKSNYNNSIAVLDETYNLIFEVKKKLVLPDITDESIPSVMGEIANEVFKKANGRKIISLLGSLEKRKGILPLLDVLQQMDPGKYFFLIAGKLDIAFNEDEKKSIQRAQQRENCHVILDGIPTENDFNSLVKITDIIYIVYINFFHSSNLLTKTSLFKKPVLSLQDHCIGKRVKQYNMGLTIPEPSVSEIKNALENFDHLFDISKNKFNEYFTMHSQARLKQSLKNILEN